MATRGRSRKAVKKTVSSPEFENRYGFGATVDVEVDADASETGEPVEEPESRKTVTLTPEELEFEPNLQIMPEPGLGYETVARDRPASDLEVEHKELKAVDIRLSGRGIALIERLYFTDGSMLQLQLYPQPELSGRYWEQDPAIVEEDREALEKE